MASHGRLIDLSHTVEHGMVTYHGLPSPTICDYLSREQSREHYAPGTEFHIGKIEMVANTGTYIDAPFHRYQNGKDLSQLPLSSLADLDGVVVRPHNRKSRGIDVGSVADIELTGRAVLFNTGWSRHWRTEAYFQGHPFLTKEAAIHLRDSGVTLVGIDSYNIDDTSDLNRPVHSLLLEANIPIVEHMTNLDRLPETGFTFYAVPVKVKEFGSFPVRAFGQLKT